MSRWRPNERTPLTLTGSDADSGLVMNSGHEVECECACVSACVCECVCEREKEGEREREREREREGGRQRE